MKSWHIKCELYYQDLYSIPIASDTLDSNYSSGYLKTYSFLNQSAGFTYTRMTNRGSGRNYGIECTVERFLNEGWYMLSTLSLYEAKYKAQDGVEHDTRFNGNYTVNFLTGKEFNMGSDKIQIR